VRQLLKHLSGQQRLLETESNTMPYGKGTYGSKVGRPPKMGRAANATAKRTAKKVVKTAMAKRKRR
tara:strand:- start:10 stop:207 length:198 start_codon:yes stop_codon:yes gene_type:complete